MRINSCMNHLAKIKQEYRDGGIQKIARSAARFTHSRTILRAKISLRTAIQSILHPSIADPYKVIWISPDEIIQKHGLFGREDVGRIVSSDWDKKATQFTDSIKYELVRRYLEDSTDWDDILDGLIFPKLESEGSWDGKTTKAEILKRYEKIGRTCADIEEDRYKSYEELGESRAALNHVAVNIGRDGEVIFAGSGYHRLSAAKVLEIEKIPVQIWVRHRQWQQLRDSIAETGEIPKEFSDHPDLKDLRDQI